MFGLLGPNGAGKSTLMRTIATLQEPDTGSITLGDPAERGQVIDVLREKDRVRRTLGYLPQEFGVYPSRKRGAAARPLRRPRGIQRPRTRGSGVVEALLRQTNLWDVRRERLGGYSGGMRQRFGIAVALLGDPSLIIVDEPTAGLDPAERVRFLNLLSEIGETGCRHPLHAHRRGRLGAVQPHGDHRQGRDPPRGRARWPLSPRCAAASGQRVVAKHELPALERRHR